MFEVVSVKWIKYVNVILSDGKVTRITFDDNPLNEKINSDIAKRLKLDLNEYFQGNKIDFREYEVVLPTKFTAKVLNEVRKIKYGKVKTYKEIAEKIGTSYRAVGQALKRNPAPIIIPCHRVVSRNGLGGYSAGIEIKKELLKLEGVNIYNIFK
ncbi:MAG TPA: methylated-DNA--[protein]-cysteine S-methyltransferase [Archaeoglobus profundus]|nr:methylated-DNA--[protein]-cysteine S-methyltransferase [Archaeoglobus profundus]HIP57850.1 methylated-DNA--[protein]-cysteine S-methyltransferase [Archaeoglobus profundus]